MATPVGHTIVGYTLARAAGVTSPPALVASIGAACLPDIDFLLGYIANRDAFSLHREVITHKPVFSLLVGAATAVAATGWSLLRGRAPTPGRVLRPAALATALVASHLAMDPLPLLYEDMALRPHGIQQLAAAEMWNVVVDLAVYGGLAMLVFNKLALNQDPAQA